jgi:hypothetical protein
VGIAAEGKTDSLCGGTIIGMEEEIVRTNYGPSMDISSSMPARTAGTVHCAVYTLGSSDFPRSLCFM